MPETFDPVTLQNDTGTKLNAAYFNRLETGLETIDDRLATKELGVDVPVTVTYAAAITINASQGSLFRIIATGNVALQEPINGTDGQRITLQIQASGADRTVTFPGSSVDAITVATGQWWIGTMTRNAGSGDWILLESSGGVIAGGSGIQAALDALDDRVTALESGAAGSTAPGAPTIGTATAGTAGSGQVSVAFTAPTSTGGSAISSYTVTSTPGGVIGTGASSPIVVSGLTAGTSYTFKVKATNATATGPESAASNAVTPVAAPGAAISLSATPGPAQVLVQWSTSRVDITSWTVGRNGVDNVGSGPWSTDVSASTTSIVFDKLLTGTTYTFTLTPHTATGTLTAQTVTAAPTTDPSPPPPSSGTWSSGASLAGVGDGSFGTWRGRSIEIQGTWCDSASAQTELWTIAPGGPGFSWTGALDIAIGGIFTSKGESWAAAATGAYDARWTSVFQKLNQYRGGRGTTYVRFAHELNGNWYEWSINSGNVASFITAWRRVYAIKQAQFPQCKLVFCPNYESTNGVAWVNMWPGDAYVDVLGVDYYNQYALLTNSSADWTSKLNSSGTVGGTSEPHGLGAYRQWAQDHGKPLGIGEWGANSEAASDSGNAAFITGLLNYVSTNAGPGAGQFLYEVYFNATDSFGYNGRFGIYPTTHMPNASAAYNAFF